MQDDNNNPYRQPDAELVAQDPFEPLPVHEAQHRSMGHGWRWLADAFALYRRHPFLWPLAFFMLWVVMMAISLVLAFIPFIGNIAAMLLNPIIIAGVMFVAREVDRGHGLELGDVFAGFRHRTGALMGLGGLYILLMIVVVVLMMVLFFVVFGGNMAHLAQDLSQAEQHQSLQFLNALSGIGVAVAVVGFIVLWGAMSVVIWFSPPLVMLGDMHPFKALIQAFLAGWRNIPAMFVFGLSLIGFSLLAMVPFGLMALLASYSQHTAAVLVMVPTVLAAGCAWLVLMVVVMLSIYTAFHDIFVAPRRG